MSYTKHTWVDNESLSASKFNHMEDGIASAGAGYDAIIRLTHGSNSGDDLPSNLTPSIIEGSYDQLYAIIDDGGLPNIRVEYYHPWGTRTTLTALITYASTVSIQMGVAGYYPFGETFKYLSGLIWDSEDNLIWD